MKYIIYISFLFLFAACCTSRESSGSVYLDKTNTSNAPTSLSGTSVDTTSKEPLLVIRVEYDNQLFVNGADIWAKKIFGNAPHQLNNYYREVSQNKFSFTPVKESDESYSSKKDDGVVTLHLHKNHPNSGSSPIIHSDLKLALEGADKFVDFKSYDTNSDGIINIDEMAVVFIIAGAEEAYAPTAKLNSVWAHQSCVNSVSIKVDGLSIASCKNDGRYALFGERHIDGILPAHDATIGIIAHELGHALFSLPDLYPTDSSVSSSGIGYFGIMAGGLWAYSSFDEGETAPGNTPSHFCAWSKIFSGWVKPTLLTSTQEILLASTSQSDYSIAKINLDSDEYLLLENRAADGYDSGLFAIDGTYVGGIALWHINDSVINEKLASNSIQNSKDAKGVDLVEARLSSIDDSQAARGDARNLFYRGNIASAQLTKNIALENISSPSDNMSVKVVQ